MKYSTDCSKCIFSSEVDSGDDSCKFKIIDGIKDIKTIDIKNNYYYINKYICKYGFSKDKQVSLEQDFPNINLIEYIKQKNYIKYYLVIDNLDNKLSLEDICNQILKLTIKPHCVSVLTRQESMPDAIKQCNQILKESMMWRLHNFFDMQIDFDIGSFTILSTAKQTKEANYVWFLHDYQIQTMLDEKAIEQINYIVNVEQPEIGIFKSKHKTDTIGGLFMTYRNYDGLTSNISQVLSIALKNYISSENISIINYDD